MSCWWIGLVMKCETRDIDVMTCKTQSSVDVNSHSPQFVSEFNVTDAISCMIVVRSKSTVE